MDTGQKRLAALRHLLAQAHEKLGLKLGFRLWDGSVVPATWPRDGLAIAIRDPGAVAALIRKPKLDTLLNLHVTDRIALENGSVFDLAAARPEGKIGRLARTIPKSAVFDVLRRFLFAPGAAPDAVDHKRGDEIARDGAPATNKANIAYHYDVSNAFYRLFLDAEMVYTCAYFTEDHGDLDRAQRDKLDMICRKLRLKPGDRLLDIGCGWGALVCHAAQHYGVEAHGVTLAEEQLALAREKVERLGLQGRVTLHLKDFTQMEGEFDKISSIGMFEHVGIRNHPTYFKAVNRLLKPRGLYLHHSISRRAKKTDKAFNKMPAEYRALVRYIFPAANSTISACRSPISSAMASRSTTSKAGASTTSARRDSGGRDCTPTALRPRRRSGRSARGCGCSTLRAARSPSSAVARWSTRRWPRSAARAPRACR